jgi:C4-dicarboxylate transporter DctM subunit
MLWIVSMVFIMLLLAGMPVGFGLGLASMIAISTASDLPLMLVVQRMVGMVDSFVLLAMPFFILAGGIMERGGISRRLIHFIACLVGHVRGGLAMVCVLSSMVFAGCSGSSAADASAIGSIQIPAMIRRGYNRAFVTALQSTASTTGPIVPPSNLAIIYGAMTNVSIGALFMAGLIPGVMIGLGLMVVGYIYSVRLGYPVEEKATVWETLKSMLDAAWALFVPVIIIGGIISGVFTATESGAIAAVYSLFIATVVYRELSIKELPQVFLKAALTTAMVMIVIAGAGVFGWIMANENLPQIIVNWLLWLSTNPTVVLLMILAFMFALGLVMEILAAGIIMIPVLYPIALQLGINEVYFAMIVIMTMAVGAVTPPVGITLYVVLGIAESDLSEVNRYIWPFIAVIVAVILMSLFIPALVTTLPNWILG